MISSAVGSLGVRRCFNSLDFHLVRFKAFVTGLFPNWLHLQRDYRIYEAVIREVLAYRRF